MSKGELTPAPELPVARVAVDSPLPHLDRPFDYLIRAEQHAAARPGVRVAVRFAGRHLAGFLLARVASSEHPGRLSPLVRVVSAEPVLAPEVATVARAVADRYAGTLADVLRLAVPPRHARVEAEVGAAAGADGTAAGGVAAAGGSAAEPGRGRVPAPALSPSGWGRYPGGADLLARLAAGGGVRDRGSAAGDAATGDGGAAAAPPRHVWAALPGGDGWAAEVAALVQATLAGGRGAVVIVPDARDVAQVDVALTTALGSGSHTVLTADLGPAERYRRFLAVRRGLQTAVVGTRAASFAPVRDPGLFVLWDDGDDLHAEPHAPYPHAREVLALRAQQAGAAMVVGGYAVTAEGARLVRSGWATPLAGERSAVRLAAPRVQPAGSDRELASDPAARAARLPSQAWRVARAALAASSPVLVQVPRRGYLPALACASCRAAARCPSCGGPLGRPTPEPDRAAVCRLCGRPAAWQCPGCGSRELRAVVVGAQRTAEELGRAFPGIAVRSSSGEKVLDAVSGAAAIVVATPGAEPPADGGYGAALLLDGWALLSRPDLRAAEEAVRRWLNAAALVRAGGEVVVMADGALPAVQALLRWAPAVYAERELDERAALHFPPAARLVTVTGSAAAVAAVLDAAELPPDTEVLGPVPEAEGQERLVLRAPLRSAAGLSAALHRAAAVCSARRAPVARIQVDPRHLG